MCLANILMKWGRELGLMTIDLLNVNADCGKSGYFLRCGPKEYLHITVLYGKIQFPVGVYIICYKRLLDLFILLFHGYYYHQVSLGWCDSTAYTFIVICRNGPDPSCVWVFTIIFNRSGRLSQLKRKYEIYLVCRMIRVSRKE